MTRLELRIDEYVVHVYTTRFDGVIALNEAQLRGVSLGGPYSAQFHSQHTSPGERHIHVYHKNNQIFALNLSGTAHDRSHGVRIPNRVATALQRIFPGVTLPPNNIIECLQLLDELHLLTESEDKEEG